MIELPAEHDWLRWLHQFSEELAAPFLLLEEREERQTARLMEVFRHAGIGQHHFMASTGYGYQDLGREALERVFAEIWGAESALVRQQISSGTQAINLCLQALAEPGSEFLIAGEPYDTLQVALGLRGTAPGNLKSRGVGVRVASLPDPSQVPAFLDNEIRDNTSLLYLQRSGGYGERPALPVAHIAEIVAGIRHLRHTPILFIDNCYGEFVEDLEPTQVGADLMAGSLIKNPGGGLAPTGAYIVGRRDLVGRVAAQLYAPGVGGEIGPSLLSPRPFFQGLFHAPHLVGQALRGATLCARAFAELGYGANPTWDEARADLVQRVTLGTPDRLLRFCRAVQSASPVEAYAQPEPGNLPGYIDPIIMAGGTFIQGSSSELTVDAPMRPPFVAYWQGGSTYCHTRLALARGLAAISGHEPPRGSIGDIG